MGAILNFSTQVDVSKTVGEVTTLLSRRGISRISTIFDENGAPSGLGFVFTTEFGPRDFELPIKLDGVYAVLVKKAEPRYRTKEQAAKVAWRIAKDWLEAQMALIDAGLAVMDQVFLPYMVDAKGRSVYELMRTSELAALERGDK